MASCWDSMRAFYESVEERIGGVFASYGRFAARHAWKVLMGSIMVNLLLGLGLLRFHMNEDNANVYFPQGSQAYLDQTKVRALFPEPDRDNFQPLQLSTLGRWAQVAVKARTGNLLDISALEELSKINDAIQDISATTEEGDNVTLSDICARTNGECYVDGSVFWSDLFKIAVQIRSVGYPYFILPNGQVENYLTQVGGNIQHNETHLYGVEYMRLMYWIRSDNASYNTIIDAWGDKFIQTMRSYKAVNLDIAYCHDKSLDQDFFTDKQIRTMRFLTSAVVLLFLQQVTSAQNITIPLNMNITTARPLTDGLAGEMLSGPSIPTLEVLILDTLHFCMRVDTEKALKANAMEVFTSLLTHKDSIIRARAARDIMDLSAPLEGKNKAVEVKAVPPLVGLLKDASPDVKANAAGALMIITITTKGKYTSLEADAIPPLVTLVDDSTSEVRANALKALTCLSEAPEGRKVLLEQVDKIKARQADKIPAVARAADIAVRVIEWKP